MFGLIVGVGHVTLYIRHARSRKDKRQSVKGIKQKLVNKGFSVAELGDPESHKNMEFGFVYAGESQAEVGEILKEGINLFFGDFEVTSTNHDVFDYSLEGNSETFDEEKYGDLES